MGLERTGGGTGPGDHLRSGYPTVDRKSSVSRHRARRITCAEWLWDCRSSRRDSREFPQRCGWTRHLRRCALVLRSLVGTRPRCRVPKDTRVEITTTPRRSLLKASTVKQKPALSPSGGEQQGVETLAERGFTKTALNHSEASWSLLLMRGQYWRRRFPPNLHPISVE